MHLVGLRALRLDQHEPARARPAEADVEQLVRFVQDARVRGLVGADDVAPNLIRPVRVVLRGVVHLPVAGGGVAVAPADAAGGASDHIRQVLSGDEVLEPHFVRLVARRIDGVREDIVRRVGSERAHGTVLERRGDLVDVQHGLPVFIVQSPDDDGVGFAFHRSDHVGVALVSPRKRNVVVGLLDASDDFIVHLLRQRLRVREVRLGVRVLSLEVRDDRRIFPIVVAEPEEVVVALDGGVHGLRAAVLAFDDAEENLVRDALSHGRDRGRCGGRGGARAASAASDDGARGDRGADRDGRDLHDVHHRRVRARVFESVYTSPTRSATCSATSPTFVADHRPSPA
mmetsp:Transcript_8968/g.36656  ORF Transcript_8968/g.36656 Transcript_8968/m.36656 type:complete len:343 (-) Transcript_8968:622-1650(-)